MKAETTHPGRLAIPGKARGASSTIPGRNTGHKRWIAAAVLLLLTAVGYIAYTRLAPSTEPAAVPQTATVTKGSVSVTVSSTGSVSAQTMAKLAFLTEGRVESVFVSVGDQVKKGQVVAKLEDSDLKTKVKLAEADVIAAQANLDARKAGSRPEEIASAAASLASAQAKLSQVQQGATQSDIQSAESSVVSARSNLVSAEAKLADLRKGPTASDLASAQTSVDQARANLATAQAKLDELTAGPTQSDIASAQSEVNSAKQALTTAEDKYEMAKGDNLAQSGFSSVSAAYQNYESAKAKYDSAVQKLDEVMAGAKAADLQSARSSVDTARSSLASAEAKLAQVQAGATQPELVQAEQSVESARASLASAEAKLSQLKAGPTQEDLVAAQASVTQAESSLALKRAPYTDSDIKSAEATLLQREVSLEQARENLENAGLLAPFDGVVSEVATRSGEYASGTVVTIIDPKQVRVDVNLAEADVAKVKVGQSTELTFDALSGQRFTGKVIAITPVATVSSGVSTYAVSLSVNDLIQGRASSGVSGAVGGFARTGQRAAAAAAGGLSQTSQRAFPNVGDAGSLSGGSQPPVESGAAAPQASDGSTFQEQPQDVRDLFTDAYGDQAAQVWARQRSSDLARESLKPGMTASVTIYTAQKDNVITVPSKAIKTQGAARTVDVLVDGVQETRTVRVGLVGDQMTEIVEGLAEGEQVIVSSATTTTTSTTNSNRSGGMPIGGLPSGGGPVGPGR